jgi:hypothetical protein
MTDSKYPTIGGVVTRGETFTKILHHLDELQDLYAVMAHLLRTEDGPMDRLLSKGWLGMVELTKMQRHKITEMAMGKLQ